MSAEDGSDALELAIAEVVKVIKTVPNVGNVQDHVAYVNDEAKFKTLFVNDATTDVRFWNVTRENTDSADVKVRTNKDLHNLLIRGYMSVVEDNASEKTFRILIEQVRAALKVNRKLNGTVFFSGPTKVRTQTSGTIGSVLVHYCELVHQVVVYPINY
ncbi:MAG TPA: hypothetical protein VN622_14205 [Clostridia bacterium]|nr:hypothetical protein [Clostridia bacterium]